MENKYENKIIENGVGSGLGLPTPARAPTVDLATIAEHKYFVTLAFPLNGIFPVFDKGIRRELRYRDMKLSEQLYFIKSGIEQIQEFCSSYKICFEFTMSVHYHLHIICTSYENQEDLRKSFNDIYKIPRKNKIFCDVKIYNNEKWNDYFVKYVKTYQTSQQKLIEWNEKTYIVEPK